MPNWRWLLDGAVLALTACVLLMIAASDTSSFLPRPVLWGAGAAAGLGALGCLVVWYRVRGR
ncbi:hypothetical protein [Saccharopolyspora montiporae]|uniref:hypothetical protein n=1 Tax=Saccharopolyspora montiporae TaxID=2781240 RepID=UPI001881324F|nr:hypothetical protein [Saccharopolyspora sp. HNM0983]